MIDLYGHAPVPVRDDLTQAHRDVIDSWAGAGNQWTGAERLAMVREVRRARIARRADGGVPPAWVGAISIDGLTEPDSPLPPPARDAVWRLTNHPGTLTADWYRTTIDGGLTPEQYVELVGVVATANCVDVFASALGLEPVPLPAARPGRPDGATVPDTAVTTHWVPTAPVRGPNVGKALTAVPVAAEAWRRLSHVQYVPPEALLDGLGWSRGALDRRQVELLAARTSLLNECFY